MAVEPFQDCFFEKFVPHVKKFLWKSGFLETALLLVDNAPSHPAIASLQCEGIIVKFLSPNMKSFVQSVDHGVIVSFKRNYWKNLLQEILHHCNEKDVNLTK